MTYLLLWRAIDKPTLFESEEFESFKEAAAAMVECHAKYPWNTYLVAQIETTAVGTGKIPNPGGEFTVNQQRTPAEPK